MVSASYSGRVVLSTTLPISTGKRLSVTMYDQNTDGKLDAILYTNADGTPDLSPESQKPDPETLWALCLGMVFLHGDPFQ